MDDRQFVRTYVVTGGDFQGGGRMSTDIKDTLKDLGFPPALIRRVAIAAYEAEMNVVMYARSATVTLRVTPDCIGLEVIDQGSGIPDVPLAMQEGYSTATAEMREMGFGAGMGLPNIKRNADEFVIASEVGRGTDLAIRVRVH
ncbi:MAG: ATP-binding protein [Acidobacteriota bacterium]